jgi:hypothetical protein
MKKIQIIFTTTLLFIALATACIKKPITPSDTCGALPCPTTTGANVASCMINGEPFIVKGKGKSIGMFNCVGGNTLNYGTLAGGYKIEFYKCPDGTNKTNILHFDIYDNFNLKEYKIADPLKTNCRLEISGGGFSFYSDSNSIGSLSITYLDNNIISGKFNFTIKDPSTGKTYTCTDGNFDLSK